jgi:hypothetical protein
MERQGVRPMRCCCLPRPLPTQAPLQREQHALPGSTDVRHVQVQQPLRYLLEELALVSEEEGEQEGADVGAVDVGIGQNDDLARKTESRRDDLETTGSAHAPMQEAASHRQCSCARQRPHKRLMAMRCTLEATANGHKCGKGTLHAAPLSAKHHDQPAPAVLCSQSNTHIQPAFYMNPPLPPCRSAGCPAPRP